MTKGQFYELVAQIDIDAFEFAKDKGDYKRICENAYAIGANAMLEKIVKLKINSLRD